MNMVERVARAIHQRMKKGGAYKYEYEVDKFSFDILAIAAIEAMRKPTQGMLNDGETAVDNCEDGGTDSYGSYTYIDDRRAALKSWQAMIDAALAEGGGE